MSDERWQPRTIHLRICQGFEVWSSTDLERLAGDGHHHAWGVHEAASVPVLEGRDLGLGLCGGRARDARGERGSAAKVETRRRINDSIGGEKLAAWVVKINDTRGG